MLPPSYKFKQTFKSLCLSFEKFSVLVQKGVSNSKWTIWNILSSCFLEDYFPQNVHHLEPTFQERYSHGARLEKQIFY